jgi:hypothetical protein
LVLLAKRRVAHGVIAVQDFKESTLMVWACGSTFPETSTSSPTLLRNVLVRDDQDSLVCGIDQHDLFPFATHCFAQSPLVWVQVPLAARPFAQRSSDSHPRTDSVLPARLCGLVAAITAPMADKEAPKRIWTSVTGPPFLTDRCTFSSC